MKFHKHASGTDLIPNKEIWISIPSNIKVIIAILTIDVWLFDLMKFSLKHGVSFTFSRIRPGYSKI